MNIEENKKVSKRWHEAWGTSGIKNAYAECLAPDFRALFFGQGWVDRATYVERDQAFMAAFDDVHFTIEDLAGEGDLVFCRLRWRARHIGPVLGIEPTGRSFEVMGFAQDRFRAGKIVEHIPLFDQASFLQQLRPA